MRNCIQRRQFLQFVGATFGSIGLSQLDFLFNVSQHQHQLLAQSTNRKRALLIGINQYSGGLKSLRGCLTDVELQYELLRYRYGFKDSDILILSDKTPQKPTRNNILRAFEEHLIRAVEPDDIVVFHYSGHGSLLRDPNPLSVSLYSSKPNINRTNGTIIPADCSLDRRNDIMGRTLFLLSSRLRTDKLTMVLDSCHSGGGTRGNQTVRTLFRNSPSNEAVDSPLPEEIQYQQKQLNYLRWNEIQFQERRKAGIAKGVAIGSAQKNQLAVDGNFPGFSAGALTYLLTRYLWQLPAPESISITFDRLFLATKELSNSQGNIQEPIKETAKDKSFEQEPTYLLKPDRLHAEAVVRKVNTNRQIEFWMGGISSQSINSFQKGSLFSIINEQGRIIGEVEQNSRSGLVGYGILKSGTMPEPGTLLRERLRNFPRDFITLKIGISINLGDTHSIVAQELKKIRNIEVLPLNQGKDINFIIGPVDETVRQAGTQRSLNIEQPNGCIGLLDNNNTPIAQSFGNINESPFSIVSRLRPKLKMLLAQQLLRSFLNAESCELSVDIRLTSKVDQTTQTLSHINTQSLIPKSIISAQKPNSIVTLDINNQEESPIYAAVLTIGDDGIMTVIHPIEWDSPELATIIKPKATTNIDIKVYGPAGFFEVLTITSTSPLRDTLKGLQTIARGRKIERGVLSFDGNTRSSQDFEDTVTMTTHDILRDLARASAQTSISSDQFYSMDSKQSGIFSAVLQVID